MNPIKFKQCNVEMAKDQEEYRTLPASIIPGPYKEVISCWKLTWKERIKILFTGKLFLSMLTFNGPLQPVQIQLEFNPLTRESEEKKDGN